MKANGRCLVTVLELDEQALIQFIHWRKTRTKKTWHRCCQIEHLQNIGNARPGPWIEGQLRARQLA